VAYSPTVAASLARQYAFRFPFGPSLVARLSGLVERYADLPAGAWVSWEGASLTQAETTAKMRALLATLTSTGA